MCQELEKIVHQKIKDKLEAYYKSIYETFITHFVFRKERK